MSLDFPLCHWMRIKFSWSKQSIFIWRTCMILWKLSIFLPSKPKSYLVLAMRFNNGAKYGQSTTDLPNIFFFLAKPSSVRRWKSLIPSRPRGLSYLAIKDVFCLKNQNIWQLCCTVQKHYQTHCDLQNCAKWLPSKNIFYSRNFFSLR